MITAVFDLSNIFFRSLYTIGGFGPSSYTYDQQFELDQLMRKVTTDTAYTIRQLNPTRIIFAMDSGSWRKQIEIEENEGYKGHRTKSESVNWDNVYGILNEFAEIMKTKGFIISKVKDAEADDLMALWVDKVLFENEEHIITVSGDEDIRQLVKCKMDKDSNLKFSTVFNPFTYRKGMNKKLYIPNNFDKWLNADEGINDIFNTSSNPNKNIFTNILKNNVDSEVVDGEEIGLKKIFCGDDGDNVPSIYTWMGKTAKGDDKEYRITKGKLPKFKEMFKLTDYVDLNDQETIDGIYKELARIAKHEPPINMRDRINRQIKLVILSKYVFPEEIVTAFNKDVNSLLESDQPNISNITMPVLLEGTKYLEEADVRKSNASESDIFGKLDQISKQLF
jgi:hypothetical protein